MRVMGTMVMEEMGSNNPPHQFFISFAALLSVLHILYVKVGTLYFYRYTVWYPASKKKEKIFRNYTYKGGWTLLSKKWNVPRHPKRKKKYSEITRTRGAVHS